jgi:hypothetical protein
VVEKWDRPALLSPVLARVQSSRIEIWENAPNPLPFSSSFLPYGFSEHDNFRPYPDLEVNTTSAGCQQRKNQIPSQPQSP